MAFPTSDNEIFDAKVVTRTASELGGKRSPEAMPSVLIADDNPFILETLAACLRGNGHKVIPATNGQEAIDRGVLSQPDVAILDVSMPVMNGLEAAERLREIIPTLPIILFSAYGDLLKSQMERLGVIAVFDKSGSLSDLLNIVDECRNRQQKAG